MTATICAHAWQPLFPFYLWQSVCCLLRSPSRLSPAPHELGPELSHPTATNVLVPLAHPTSITATNNYDQPCVAIAFATSRPGESLVDFKQRLSVRDYYTRTRGVELVLDREAAEELVRLLVPVVGRSEIGLMIDTPWPR